MYEYININIFNYSIKWPTTPCIISIEYIVHNHRIYFFLNKTYLNFVMLLNLILILLQSSKL